MFGFRSADSIWASSHRLHQQAGHMTASDQIGTSLRKHLANRGPSTYGSRVAPLRGLAGMTVSGGTRGASALMPRLHAPVLPW